MGGGDSGTPSATNEERKLAELASRKYDMAKDLQVGSNVLSVDAGVDRSNRYAEQALGSTAEALAAKKESPLNTASVLGDLRAGVSAANAGKSQADKESAAKTSDVVQNTLGAVGSTSAAIDSEARRKMLLEQATVDAKNTKSAATIGAIGSIAGLGVGLYGDELKKFAGSTADAIKTKAKATYYGDRNPNSPYFRGSI